MRSRLKHTSVRLTEDLKNAVDAAARQQGFTAPAAFVRKTLRDAVTGNRHDFEERVAGALAAMKARFDRLEQMIELLHAEVVQKSPALPPVESSEPQPKPQQMQLGRSAREAAYLDRVRRIVGSQNGAR